MKQKFDIITSTCVPLPLENVDTDQIIPARFLKATTREITWAVIFIVFSVLATVSAVVDIINVVDVAENIFVLIDSVIDFVLYFFYVKAAKQVLAAA